MRLFTGLSIPADLSNALASVQEDLRPVADLRWSLVENLHITTRFIGEWPEERLPELRLALKTVNSPEPFTVSAAGFGFLPNPARPKIFFAGVDEQPGLRTLAEETGRVLAGIGIDREEQAYLPHITLARIARQDVTALCERIATQSISRFGSFEVTEHHLYSSRQSAAQSGTHSEYSVIDTYSLSKGKS